MRRGVVIAICAALLSCGGGGAALASTAAIHTGTYAPLESWVQKHTSASVDLEVIKHGTMIRAKGSRLTCPNNGVAPLNGIYAGTPYTTVVPHALSISKSGKFPYSGTLKISAYEDQTPYPITTRFSISGHFVRGTIKPYKTIAVTGKVSSSDCAAKTPHTFKFIYDPGD